MRLRRLLALVILSLSFAAPAAALSGRVLLGFSETYASAGGSKTHYGTDVAMEAGASVTAPASGTVRFAGRIPSAAGGTAGCVTLDTAQGTVTLMPLEAFEVSVGNRASEGDAVGSLAGDGDSSSAESHLHVGLKKGSIYLDPVVLLQAAPAANSPEPDPSPSTAPSLADAPSPQTAADSAPGASGVSAPVAEPAPTADPAPPVGAGATGVAPAGVSAAVSGAGVASAADGAGGTTSNAFGWAGGEAGALQLNATPSNGVAPGVTDGSRVRSSSLAVHQPAESPSPASAHAARPTLSACLPSRTAPLVVAALAAIAAAATFLVTRRSLTRRIAGQGPVSDRLGTLLQHLKAGDTLCGLTSCSGPLPSQSRGH